jgi:hypothetical protein
VPARILEEASDILEQGMFWLLRTVTNVDADVMAELLVFLKLYQAKQRGDEDVSLEPPEKKEVRGKKKSAFGDMTPEDVTAKIRPMFIHLSRSVVAACPESVIDHLVMEVDRALTDHVFKRDVWVNSMRPPAHLL